MPADCGSAAASVQRECPVRGRAVAAVGSGLAVGRRRCYDVAVEAAGEILARRAQDSVVEILRSMAELMIWGDQRDASIFEYFMEKQVMVLFLQILELSSNTTAVVVQLLQTINIMVQNIRSDHAIYYIFSNGYLNHFITYPYDFRDEELLAYYISFLRTTSTKLDQTTISFFITTENDNVVSFPLYTEGIKFFRHEESMVRIAVRTLTLNIYHVNDDSVRKFVSSDKAVGYIADIVGFLKEKSFSLHALMADAERNHEPLQSKSRLEGCIAETEEILDYCNDIVSAGIPGLARAMTDNLMHVFVLPLLCSLASENALSALYLLARVLCLIRHKPLANGVAAALVCESFLDSSPPEQERRPLSASDLTRENGVSSLCPMELVLSHVISDSDRVIVASVTFLLALLHNEVDDAILEVLGLLPRLKQHKRRLLQALMGSNSDEELFGDEDTLDVCDYSTLAVESEKTVDGKRLRGTNFCRATRNDRNAKCNSFVRMQEAVVKKLLELLCRRPPPCIEALWQCGALLRQIFPYHQENSVHSSRIAMIRTARIEAKEAVLKELDDCWCDAIPFVVVEVWQKSRKALEGSYYRDDSTTLLIQAQRKILDDRFSSSVVADRMQEAIQVFVALHQLLHLLIGESVPEALPLDMSSSGEYVAKVGTEVDLSSVDALPCRIAFERGKERDMYLVPTVSFTAGWLVLADGVSPKGVIRVIAPLAGCLPEIDEEHKRWLHLRIRPPQWPHRKQTKPPSRTKRVDGRWTLAFADPQSCEKARDAVVVAMTAQKNAVLELLKPLLEEEEDHAVPI
ncbi:hypothetical protein SELMODRAFT_405955 [Selaginella moellendorffii]|uniref:FPL domain-containing protein n=1 Tax=Selaginella moellendorffii TaxID=88036 RepID=D8R072_SELML|nr:hypothetical protein SELMODRAFT_405955 [Selaginella moellendorffii]